MSSLFEAVNYIKSKIMNVFFEPTVGFDRFYDNKITPNEKIAIEEHFKDQMFCYIEHQPTVKWLLRQGANIDKMPPEVVDLKAGLVTPLCLVVARGNKFMTRYLIRKNAQLRPKGSSLIHVAVSSGHVDIVQILLDELHIDERDPKGITPLSLAMCSREHLDMIKFLLNRGADYEKMDLYTGYRPIMSAIGCKNNIYKDTSALKILLDFIEEERGKEGLVQYLNDNDNSTGWTALHKACENGWYDAAELLLQRGIDPDVRDNEGYPAIIAFEEDSDDKEKFIKLFEKYKYTMEDAYY